MSPLLVKMLGKKIEGGYMEVLEAIKTRRSIRNYKPTPVDDKAIELVLEAARWAPSWANTQCWEIIVVKDPEKKRALSSLLKPERNPARNAVANAPVVLAVCGRKGTSGYYRGRPVTEKGDWLMFDVALAVQNMALAVHALGLGAVIVGALDHRKASELLNIPEDVELVALMPIGKPAAKPKTPPRKELDRFVFLDSYGNPLMFEG